MITSSESINYRRLLYFTRVAEEGTIAQAARKLNVAASSISEQIKQLEHDFGVLLFRREKNSMVLTDDGRNMLRYARLIFRTGERLFCSFSSKETLDSLVVGISNALSRAVVADHFLSIFDCKGVYITVRFGSFDDLKEELITSHIDLLLSLERPGLNSRNVINNTLDSVTLCLAAKKGSEFTERSLSERSPIPFFTYPKSSPCRLVLDNFFEQKRLPVQNMGETSDVVLLRSIAMKGLGVVALPELMVKSCSDLQSLARVEDARLRMYASHLESKPDERVTDLVRRLRGLAKI